MLAPWKKSYDKPITAYVKTETFICQQVCIVKGKIFPVVRYGCDSWTIKKAEH